MYKYKYIWLSIYLLSSCCFGCGTIASRYQVLSISTTEPGVNIYKLDDSISEVQKETCLQGGECELEKIGVSPMFYRGKRKFSLNLLLEK